MNGTSDKHPTIWLCIPLAYLDPTNPRFETNKASILESLYQRSHLDSWCVSSDAFREGGAAFFTDKEPAHAN